MITRISLFILAIFAYTTSYTQVQGGNEVFEKLFDMYAFEKYEACAKKAASFTENDKYKKSPEPYLYISMCYFQIAQMDEEDLDEVYKWPVKTALQYAYKFRKKDKDESIYDENVEYFTDLKKLGVNYAQDWEEKGKYSKASSTYKYILKFDYNDENIRFMKGVCDLLNRNSQGATYITEAMKHIPARYKNSSYEPDKVSEPVLIRAFKLYSDYLVNASLVDSAKKTMTLAKDILGEHETIKKQHSKIYGTKYEKPKEEKKEKDEMDKKYEKHYSDDPNKDSESSEKSHYRRNIPR